MFRLVLTCRDGINLDNDDDEQVVLDLKPEDVKACKADPSPPLSSHELAPQILSLRLRALGRPTFVILTWIAFAMRPFSVDELDLILAQDQAEPDCESPMINIQHGLAVRLLKDISQTAETKLGRVFLRGPYSEMQRLLSEFSSTRFGFTTCAHHHIAQSCTSFLKKTHIFTSFKARGACDSEGAGKEDDEKPIAGQDVSFSQASNCKAVVDEMPTPRRTLAECTARNWLTHYRLGTTSQSPPKDQESEPFLSFVKDHTNVYEWLYLVQCLSAPPYQKDPVISNNLETVLHLVSLDKLQDLEIHYQLASRPSSLPWPGRLLVHTSELGDKTIVGSLAMSFGSIEPEAIARALAATQDEIHEEINASVMSKLKDRYVQTVVQAQLAAQVLQNVTTSKKLREELLAMSTWEGHEARFSDAVDRAVGYSDEETLGELLSHQSLAERIPGLNEESMWTHTHRAAYHGSLGCMTKVYKTGCSLNAVSADGYDPLFIGSTRGFEGIVRFLALNRAHMDGIYGVDGRTALHAAGLHGHWKTTNTLLDRGVDVTASDTYGNFALHLATRQGHSRVAELMIDHFPTVADTSGFPRQDETARSKSADPNLTGSAEVFDLSESREEYILVEGGDAEYPEAAPPQLVDDSPSALLDMADWDGVTPLATAASRDMFGVMKHLLERGADPNMLDDSGRTALHLVAKAGRTDLITALIATGAVTNQMERGNQGIPLHNACYRGHTEAVELLAASSDLTTEDSWGRTPLAAACAGGHLKSVKALIGHYGTSQKSKSLISAAQNGYPKVVKFLLDSGCPVNERGEDGGTALLSAVIRGRSRMVELLILRGADTGCRYSSGGCAILISS